MTCVPSPPFSVQHGVQTCQPQSAHRNSTLRLCWLQMSHLAVWMVTGVKVWWRVGISARAGVGVEAGWDVSGSDGENVGDPLGLTVFGMGGFCA